MAHAEVVRPDGEGPFPTVVMFHACLHERAQSQRTWASFIREGGWAAVIVDSYSPRGFSRLDALAACVGLKFWGRERAGDVFAAVAWARQQSWVDREAIVAIGWSHGGWAVLDAMAIPRGEYSAAATRLSGLPDEPHEGLAGAFVFYPYLGVASVARESGAFVYSVCTTAIVAANDFVVGSRRVERVLENLSTDARPVRVEIFEGATHGFDMPEVRDPLVRYSDKHTARARTLLLEYLSSISAARSDVNRADSCS